MEGQLDLDFIIKKANIKPAMTVADYGCGAGFLSRKLAQVVTKTGIVYAVDVVRESLNNLQRLANLEGVQNIKTIWSNLELYGATDMKKEIVDAGFIINTLSQSNKEKDFLDEIFRMIKINGIVVVVDWKDEAVSPIAPLLKDRTGIEKLKKICKDLGNNIEISEIFNLGNNYYGAILKKNK